MSRSRPASRRKIEADRRVDARDISIGETGGFQPRDALGGDLREPSEPM